MNKYLTPMIMMLLCIFYSPNNILAQTRPDAYFNTEASFTSAPLSPNATSTGLHAVVPRSLSVGLPSIDIPVCGLEDVDISVPVTLQYHPDAVKPDEHPGWVGLGWNLKAGGSIVRISKGKHDEVLAGYYDMHRISTADDPNPNFNPSSLLNNFYWNFITDPISSPADFLPVDENFEDYEPDEFIFNFGGYSGKFYFNHEGEWVFTTNSGEHFEMSVSDAPVNTFSLSGNTFGDPLLAAGGSGFASFTITTNDGTKYTFGGASNSVEYTRTVVKDDNGQDDPSVYDIFPTAWHLTKIESVNGNDVDFSYQRSGVIFKKSLNFNLYNEYDCNLVACGAEDFKYPTTLSDCHYDFYDTRHIIYPSYLSRITGTDNNIIQFTITDSNQDNYGNINIFGLSENTYSKYPKLSNIILKRNNTVEKEMVLTYNDDPTTTVNRLKLNEIHEIDNSNNRLPGYQFTYNAGNMPPYHSFKVDHWGYKNPAALFDPSAAINCSPPIANPGTYINSDDMAPNVNSTKASVLKGITYPMGGYKEFTYEKNISFKRVEKDYGTSNTEANYPDFRLVNINAEDGKDVGGLRIKTIKTYENNIQTASQTPLTSKTYSYEGSGILDFTSYGIEQGHFTDVNKVKYWNIHHNNVNTLRQTNNRHICYSTVMETQADDGHRVLKYSNFDEDLYGITTLLDEKTLEHKAQIDPSLDLDLNIRSYIAPYSSRSRERGKLLQEDAYRGDGTLLRSTSNTYTPLNTETAYQVRCINRHYGRFDDLLPTARVEPPYNNARATAYYEYIYPVHITAQEVAEYNESGGSPRITTRDFEYDYANNDGDLEDDNNVRTTTVTNSDGKVYRTTYKYTTDFDFGSSVPNGDEAQGIAEAQNQNLFLPVETLRWLDHNGASYLIGGQVTTYKAYGADVVPFKTYRLVFPDNNSDGNLDMISSTNYIESIITNGTFVRGSGYELYMTYDEYSSTGTPQQVTQDGGTPNSILLSKDELRTVASVTNAAYNDIAYTSFEGYGGLGLYSDGRWTITESGLATMEEAQAATSMCSPSIFGRDRLCNGIYTVSTNVSSSGTYRLSFWGTSGLTLNGQFPGMEEIPAAANSPLDGWSYYRAVINLPNSNSNFSFSFGSTSNSIDELRLHPIDALMTTTTYDDITLQTLVTADENSKPIFYEYDDFERVIAVQDQDGNLMTDYEYLYRQTDNVPHNSVRTHSHWIEGAASGAGTTNDNHVQSTQYMDGLGRPIQSIVTAKSPLEYDIIQIRAYDTDGREPNRYHPFTYNGGNGNFLTNATMMQQAFHSNTSGVAQTNRAYQNTYFEPSTMSRSKIMRPEGSYASEPIMMEYNVTGLPTVKDFQIDVNGNVTTIANFPDTELNNTLQNDENNNITINYTDKLGRTILSRRRIGSVYADTYTVYDNFGNVRYIIPPEAVENLGTTPSLANVADLIYEYKYDYRQRMIYKKIPGADAEEYVYDYIDRIILMQDGNRNTADEWLFTKYDALGRVILTGIYNSTNTQVNLQIIATLSYAANPDNLYETPQAITSGIMANVDYTNGAFPLLTSNDVIHTVNYYDNYDFDSNPLTTDVAFVNEAGFSLAADTRLNNMLTGTRTKILNTTSTTPLLTTAMWYDKYGRTIQVQADNHLNGTDRSHFDYEFATDVLLESKRIHTASGQATRTIAQRYEYDHARRVTDVYHKIDLAPEVHIKNVEYNELGQVISNSLHGNGLGDYLQSVDYRYNERGWLTRINNTNIVNDPMCCTDVQLRVFLEGSYDEDIDEMTTKLNTGRHLLPGQTPTSPIATPTPAGQPYKNTPWGYGGQEGTGFTDADYNSDVTDWVLVSFRTDSGDGIVPDAGKEIFKTAALLLKDGTVQFLDNFALPSDITSVYIVVEHLNHMGVMTPQPVTVNNNTLTYDFTTAQNNINDQDAGQKELETGVWGLYAGDGVFNQISYDVNGSDKIIWEDYNGVFDRYLLADFDRNGDVNGNDKVLWYDNNGISSRVSRNQYPNATIDIDATQGASTQNDLFGMSIYYKKVDIQLNSTPQYNGNISHVLWQVNNGAAADTKAYQYNYDQLDRLTNANYAKRGNGDYTTDAGLYSVQNISYDLNGNILGLTRSGLDAGNNMATIDNLTYEYLTNENRLAKVSDSGTTDGFTDGTNSGNDYTYDANGNLISDLNKGISSITYNYLNLPQTITINGSTITFLYDANGNKLKKTVSGIAQDYLGGIEYRGGLIDAIYHEEGRATLSGTWQYEYYLKDQLGNTRVVFTDSNNDGTPEIIQEADYYPFGMQHASSTTATNHYLYNGKELNTELGLDWYDYGFRWYDAEIGRFPSVDPIIENFPDLTPYNYASNNPSTLIDLWGLQGVNPYFFPRDAENTTDYLHAALQKFAIAFNEAKALTITSKKEYGYGIFTDEKGNLEITDRIKGESVEVNVGAYIMDVKEQKTKDRLSSRIQADPNDGANVSELFLVGVYHTHPDDGQDENPISLGDAKMFTSVLKSKWKCYGGFAIGKGFFVIADDVNGGRYAFVVENLEKAGQASAFLYPSFVGNDDNRSLAGAEVDGMEGETVGQRHRAYYPLKFENSGIELYYNASNSASVLQLQTIDNRVPVQSYEAILRNILIFGF